MDRREMGGAWDPRRDWSVSFCAEIESRWLVETGRSRSVRRSLPSRIAEPVCKGVDWKPFVAEQLRRGALYAQLVG